MKKSKFRVLIKHYFSMGTNTVQAKNTDDAERTDHQNSAVVPENIKNGHKMVLADRKLKLREIDDTL